MIENKAEATSLSSGIAGAIDCDVHANVPGFNVLLPYLSDYWRDMIDVRGMVPLDTQSYPPKVPFTARKDWRGISGYAATTVDEMRSQLFDGWGVGLAIVNCLWGVQLLHDDDMAAVLATAVNDWLAAEWLAVEPRLRGSIVVAPQNPQSAVEEIERRAGDRRFVQVLMLVMGDMPLGKRMYWPIYETAARYGLPIGIHAGSNYRRPATALGWPSYWAEDYIDQPQAFQAQLSSLISHGVMDAYPDLRVVLIESGVSWLPAYLWRFSKSWRGCRIEVPWVKRDPLEIVREQVRLTTQPIDAPEQAAILERIIHQLGSDKMLLFSSDYPHWQFEGDAVLPIGVPTVLRQKILVENALETYARLGGSL